MSTLTCRNCEALEDLTTKKINCYELLCAENISLHHTLTAAREEVRHLNSKILKLQSTSFSDQQEIVKLHIETEYLKCQLSHSGKQGNINISKLLPMVEYHKKITDEHLSLIENETDLLRNKREQLITKVEDHIKILLDELKICHKELINQSKQNLNERRLFRELLSEEKLRTEVQLNNFARENSNATQLKMEEKFDKIVKYKDEQLRRQECLISILRKQQEAIYNQYHKLTQNKEKVARHSKLENGKLKAELEKMRLKYEKLEKRRLLEVEGYRTQIKVLNNKLSNKKI